MRAFAAAAAASAGVTLLPAAARACAVCSALGTERTRKAFLDTTIFLSLLPLGLIAAGLWWIARRAGRALAEDLRESPDAVVPTEGAKG